MLSVHTNFWVKFIFRDWKEYQCRKIKKLLFWLWLVSVGRGSSRRHPCSLASRDGAGASPVRLLGLQPAPALSSGEQGRRRRVPLAVFAGSRLSVHRPVRWRAGPASACAVAGLPPAQGSPLHGKRRGP